MAFGAEDQIQALTWLFTSGMELLQPAFSSVEGVIAPIFSLCFRDKSRDKRTETEMNPRELDAAEGSQAEEYYKQTLSSQK